MPSKRLNQKLAKKREHAEHICIAPPKGFAYAGKPIRAKNTEDLRRLISDVLQVLKDSDVEAAAMLQGLADRTHQQLLGLLKISGFTLVKRKELKINVRREESTIQASARPDISEADDPRGVTQFFTSYT